MGLLLLVHQYGFRVQGQLGGVRRGRAALRLSELKEARRLCGILGGGMAGVVCDDGRPHQQVRRRCWRSQKFCAKLWLMACGWRRRCCGAFSGQARLTA